MRTALLLGFAVVFVLWLASIYYFTLRLAEIEALSAGAHEHHEQGQELLLTVRAQVLLGSIYIRDALDETDANALLFYRRELQTLRGDVERALEQYLPDIDLPAEREHWSRLQAELHDYWNTMLPLLTWEPARMTVMSDEFLRTQVVPKREVIMAISDGIRGLNEEAFRQEQGRLDLLHRSARRRVWGLSGIAVVLGLGIATVATRHVGRLESTIRYQHTEVLENRRELQQLSAQLVRAQEDERRTIARELHDEIGQALTAIDVQVAVAERYTEPSGTAAQSLAEARSVTEQALHTVRDLSELLHPSTLDDFGLAGTLDWYLQAFSERTGIRTELVQGRMNGRMPSELEVCAYRIIQEALTNVVKHAHATSCRIFLQRLPHSLLVTIEDNGQGFDPGRVLPRTGRRGLGLIGIRERVAALQGTVRLESCAGKGTCLTAEFPVSGSGRDAGVEDTNLAPATMPEEH